MVESIYLAALSRHPTTRELQQAGEYLAQLPRQSPGPAGPVLGAAEFQRVHPDPLRPTRARPRRTASRSTCEVSSRPRRPLTHAEGADPCPIDATFGQMTRRHWLGHLASTALGIPAIQFFSSLQANAQHLRKTNRSIIVLWMGGGPSHLDIWDLKPESEKNGGAVQADRHLGPRREDHRAPAEGGQADAPPDRSSARSTRRRGTTTAAPT